VEVGVGGLEYSQSGPCAEDQKCLEAMLWPHRMMRLTLAAEGDNTTVGVWWREVRVQLHLRREVMQLDTLRVEEGPSGRGGHRVS
jgi:hypothetical protein